MHHLRVPALALLGLLTLSPGALAAAPGTAAKPVKQATMIKVVPTAQKLIAFTFDDGPNNRYTPKVLEILRQHGAQATFFVIGQEVVRHPEMIRRIEAAGMEIGNHGMHHRLLRNIPESEAAADVQDGAAAIVAAGGHKPYLYRLPAALSDTNSRTMLGKLGYVIVSWSVDTRDWQRGIAADRIVQTVMRHAAPGRIVIMHDGPAYRMATLRALPQVLDALSRQGYRVVSVGQLLHASSFASMRNMVPTAPVQPKPLRHDSPAQAHRAGWNWRRVFQR